MLDLVSVQGCSVIVSTVWPLRRAGWIQVRYEASPLGRPPLSREIILKDETLNRMIFFGERSLRAAVRSFLRHYHTERNHQGLRNTAITQGEEVDRRDGAVITRERLGGLLRYYYRAAA